MQIEITFEPSEVALVRMLVDTRLKMGRRMVVNRQQFNVKPAILEITLETLWETHLMCLLTSVQNSGPTGPVMKFLDLDPFPLSLENCRQARNVKSYAFEQLQRHGGIRFTTKISEQIDRNLSALENGNGWDTLTLWKGQLLAKHFQSPSPAHMEIETKAAAFVDKFFEGFGPKQSRNFWQSLGLTRYSSVLDSRLMGWMRKNLKQNTGLFITAGLSDETYYQFVSNLILDLCQQADVLPCMFDAAVFDSMDTEEWDTDKIW